MAKIFVGGLSWDTSDDSFKTYFKQFGVVEEAIVMRDRMTGTSRGFGFVTFKDTASMDAVLGSTTPLELDGRPVDCKSAVPKEEIQKTGQRTKKIFVGGLSPDTTESEFSNYFSKFGTVTEAIIMMDHDSKRSRGFGFITYDSEDSVEDVMRMQDSGKPHSLTDKVVECKKAVPKTTMEQQAKFKPGNRIGFQAPYGGGLSYVNGASYRYPPGGYGYAGNGYSANGGYYGDGFVYNAGFTAAPAFPGPPAQSTGYGYPQSRASYQSGGGYLEFNDQQDMNNIYQAYGRSPTRGSSPTGAAGSNPAVSSRHHPYR